MRPIYLALVAVVALLVAGAIVLPRLLDSSATRDQVERRMEQLLDRPVDLRGHFDFTLLPTPVLSVGDVFVGNPLAADEPWLLSIDRMDMDVAVGPLLTGRFNVTGARIVRPSVLLRDREALDRLGPAPMLSLLDLSGAIPVSVFDGNVSLQTGADNREIAMHSLDIRAQPRDSGQGVEIEFNGNVGDELLRLDLEARPENSNGIRRLRLDGDFGVEGGLLGFVGDIDVGLTERDTLMVRGDLGFNSRKPGPLIDKLEEWTGGNQPLAPGMLDQPVGFEGSVAWTDHDWSIEEATLDLWQGSVELSGSGGLGAFALELEADRLVLPDDVGNRFGHIRRRLAQRGGAQGTVDARINDLQWQGIDVQRLRLGANVDAAGSTIISSSLDLPGSGTAQVTGAVNFLDDQPVFDGRIDAATQNADGLMAWLGYPDDRDWALPFSRVTAESAVEMSAGSLMLTDMALSLDASKFEGSLALVEASEDDRPRLTLAADLNVDRLDLDSLSGGGMTVDKLAHLIDAASSGTTPEVGTAQTDAPQSGSLEAGTAGASAIRSRDDQDRAGSAIDFAVNLKARRVRAFGETLNALEFEAHADDALLIVKNLNVDRFLGARIDMTARLDRTTGVGQSVVDVLIERPARLARVLNLPEPAVVSAMAPISATARLEGRTQDFEFDVDVEASDSELEVSGRMIDNKIASSTLDGVKLESARLGTITRLLGYRVAQGEIGDRPLSVDWRLDADDGLASGAIDLGDARISADYTLVDLGQGLGTRVEGDVSLVGIDEDLWGEVENGLAARYGINMPDPTGWFGRWPRTQLPPLIDFPYATDLAFLVQEADDAPPWLGGTIRHEPGRWQIEGLGYASPIGMISGDFAVFRTEAGIASEGDIVLDDGRLAPIMDILGIETGLGGDVALDVEFTTSGQSAEQWVRGLSGEGHIDIAWQGIDEAVNPGPIRGPFNLHFGIADLTGEGADGGTNLALDLPAWMLVGNYRSQADGAEIRLLGPLHAPNPTILGDTPAELEPPVSDRPESGQPELEPSETGQSESGSPGSGLSNSGPSDSEQAEQETEDQTAGQD